MSDNTKAITFWNFLKENTIEIPIIQRDYAQGRLGKENLRKNFLKDLRSALNDKGTLKLDFVYGSMENGNLNPLDGQQRLTTLWLLHWYIALHAGELNEDNCKIFRNFTYETRISSREFCENLCKPEYFKNFNGNDIVGFITKQTWFYSAWKQDPTIQSMLRMLGGTKIADKNGDDIIDGFEELFKCSSGCVIDGKVNCGFKRYWEKLVSVYAPIVFYYLPLHDFGLSDDLYIKMNARGKQLTSFENFKADLIGYITKQAEDNQESEWTGLLDAENGIPIKLDTDWTDIFWKNKSKESKIDEIYFAFINRFFLQELICAKKEDKTDLYSADNLENENVAFRHLYGEKGDDSRLQYSGLDKYLLKDSKLIPLSFFTSFRDTLNNFKPYSGCKFFGGCCINAYFPTWVDSKFEFIPKYDERGIITTLGQKERVAFLSVCRYFEKGGFDSISFKRWMRVVWDIVENSSVETISAMIGAMRLIDKLSEGAHDIYNFLSNSQLQVNFAKDQVAEEIAKAKQILDENGTLRKYEGSCKKKDGSDYQTWEEIIIEAEKYAFFKGAIRFLFTDGDGTPNWSDFDAKWENTQKYFDEYGVKEKLKVNAILLRALLSRIDISEDWFGYTPEFWRDTLLENAYKSVIHDLLMAKELDIDRESDCWITDNHLLSTLLKENNEWHILHDWRGYSVLTRYSRREQNPRSLKEIVVLNKLRDRLLHQKDIIFIDDNHIIAQTRYLYGWDIFFRYRDYDFQWYGDPNEEELDVYLMYKSKEGYMDYLQRKKKLLSEKTENREYFCFRVEKKTNKQSFLKMLDNLISQKKGDSPTVC